MAIDLIFRNCGQLVTMAGAPGARRGAAQSELGIIERGAVAIAAGKIVETGPDEAIARLATSETRQIDARGRLVTPGLIDAHTHLVFDGTRPEEFEMRALGRSYADIMAAGLGIYATVESTRESRLAALIASARVRLNTMVSYGTTTVEAKSGYGLEIVTELKQLDVVKTLMATHPADLVPTFLGAHAVPHGISADDFADYVCREGIPAVVHQGVARFCDVFCETGAFTPAQTERILLAGQALGLRSKIHADELTDTGGAALAARLGAISADHLHCVSDGGLRALAASDTVAVLLPGTATFLGLRRHAPARAMIDLGIPVAIATDFNPGSCYCESLPLMMTLACSQLGLSASEALSAVTVNAAVAVGMESVVGSLAPGMQADAVIWDADDYHMLPYHMGARLASVVIKRGVVIHGSTD